MIASARPLLTVVTQLALIAGAAATADARASCNDLSAFRHAGLTITETRSADVPAPHCRVTGKIEGDIGYTVWLPDGWNGKFVMGGEGGFAGGMQNQALRFSVLEKGYATATTDTGHEAPSFDASWALGDTRAQENYGHRAVHLTAVAAKAMVAAYYGEPARAAYFSGCGNGGREALMEAQRYPQDFDAIVAGAPALDTIGVAAAFVDVTRHMYPDPNRLDAPVVSLDDRILLRSAIIERCDGEDGLEDGILNNPTDCPFRVQSLACGADRSKRCLKPEHVAAIESVYQGPHTPAGLPVHVGFPFGAEDTASNGWTAWLTGARDAIAPGVPSLGYAFGLGFMRNFVYQDPDWTYRGYDFSTLLEDAEAVRKVLNPESPDLDAFRARGGKLLMYHGWSDVALSARMSINYILGVYSRDESAREDVRLFMMPGVLHCSGGNGPWEVDWVDAIDAWHQSGKAPDDLAPAFSDGSGARKICAWPEEADYQGGSDRSPDSFRCE